MSQPESKPRPTEPTTVSDWNALWDTFHAARELPLTDRADFLHRACGANAARRAELTGLLKATDDAGAFLAHPIELAPDDGAAMLSIPDFVGRYRIRRVIGAGGMGVVYEAEQEHPRRAVAVKVQRGGPYVDARRLRLFQREIDSLARLKHPAIAAIFEAGFTAEGQHFFAMELVEGRTLHEYVHACGETFGRRARLELFVTLCDAVNYAHQRGVIHRDLKPSNIVIVETAEAAPRRPIRALPGTPEAATPDPETAIRHLPYLSPKILDFGLARITDADLSLSTEAGGVGEIIGTLAYMSPEQAGGRAADIDTRSDVYALGIILYELLTGALPYDVGDAALPAALRIIRDQPPRRPSTLARPVRGDLETIVLKALEKEPARRYPSAAALGEDVRRCLDDEPILARPPSFAYQLRKLIARYRLAAALVAAIFLLLVASTVTTAVQALRIRAERDRAVRSGNEAARQAAVVRATNDFLNKDLLRSADPRNARGREVTVAEVLDNASRAIAGRFEHEPLIEASIRLSIGATYRRLGKLDAARPHLERALALQQAAGGQENDETLAALWELAVLDDDQAQYHAAEALFRKVLDVHLRRDGEDSAATSKALDDLAVLLEHEDRYAESEALYLRELQARQRRGDAADADGLLMMNNLARLYQLQGRYVEGAAVATRAVESGVRVLGADDPTYLFFMNTLAALDEKLGRYAASEDLHRQTLEVRRRVLGEAHYDTLTSLHNLGRLRKTTGRFGEAEPLLRQAAAGMRAALGDEHVVTLRCTSTLGDLLTHLGHADEAERLLRGVLAAQQRVLGDEHVDVATTMEYLAAALRAAGSRAEATRFCESALALRRKLLGNDHPDVATSLSRLAEARLDDNDFAGAETLLRECGAIRAARLPPEHWLQFSTLSLLGSALAGELRYDDAERALLEAQAALDAASEVPVFARLQGLERIVAFYQQYGAEEEAAVWRAELERAQPAVTHPPRDEESEAAGH